MWPWILKGAAFGGGAVVAKELADRGRGMLRRAFEEEAEEAEETGAEEGAPGLAGAQEEAEAAEEEGKPRRSLGDAVGDFVEGLDIFDLFGRKKARHEAELAEQEKQRAGDKKAAAKARRADENARKKEAAADKARDAATQAAIAAQGSRFQAALKSLEDRLLAAQKSATTATQKAAADASLRNLRAVQAANARAQQGDASSGLLKILEAAKGLVESQGTAPDASVFEAHGITVPGEEDASPYFGEEDAGGLAVEAFL